VEDNPQSRQQSPQHETRHLFPSTGAKPVVGDLTGDGKDDLVIATQPPLVEVVD